MTLSRVVVDVGQAFDYGMVYVALSRCISLAGLWLSSHISPGVVKAHPAVLEFSSATM